MTDQLAIAKVKVALAQLLVEYPAFSKPLAKARGRVQVAGGKPPSKAGLRMAAWAEFRPEVGYRVFVTKHAATKLGLEKLRYLLAHELSHIWLDHPRHLRVLAEDFRAGGQIGSSLGKEKEDEIIDLLLQVLMDVEVHLLLEEVGIFPPEDLACSRFTARNLGLSPEGDLISWLKEAREMGPGRLLCKALPPPA